MIPLQTIPLKQVLAEMQTATEPFTLRFMKWSEQTKQGGEIVEVPGLLLSGSRDTASTAPRQATGAMPAGESAGRNPNHYANMTRNLRSRLNGRYTKVHIYLILQFNGKKVII